MVNKNNMIHDAGQSTSGDSKTTVRDEGVAEAMERGEYVENPRILALISSLTALMLQVKQLADG